MEYQHKPVLLEECINNLKIKPDGIYVDGTLGGAGHSSEIYKRLGEKGMLICFDRDLHAIEVSTERLLKIPVKAKLMILHSNFKNMKLLCNEKGIKNVDGILLDLGVSSYQLDDAERGFSYQLDAPLDMRMDKSQELNAEIVVNEYDEDSLKRIISDYGEEKWASRIASFIVKARKDRRIRTTGELVEIIKAAIPSSARREGPHPAKRTFQAIRIEVNNELGILEKTIEDAVELLGPGGRLCIITFHSLEDRIVKSTYKKIANPCICPPDFPVCTCGRKGKIEIITRKPILPGNEELRDNPRARSAKLRVAERFI